jgi:hypothetical protein
LKHSLLRGLLAGHSATLLWGALFVPLSAGRTALRLAAGLPIVLGILLTAYPLALVASLGAYMLASSALILVCALGLRRAERAEDLG